MEPENIKRISSDYIPEETEKGRITGENTSSDNESFISGDEPNAVTNNTDQQKTTDNTTAKPDEITDEDLLAKATSEGGLTQIPLDFEQKLGSWRFILSNNPFENLYIDYKQKHLITPEMVQNNYGILNVFWQDKLLLMSRGATEKLKARYGEETINNAQKILETAYNKLKTAEGIDNYYKELEGQRITNGITAIASLVNITMADGELTPNKASHLVVEGIANNLSETETRNYILKQLNEKDFEIRSKQPKDDPLKNVWRQKGVKDPVENIVNWLGNEVGSLEEMGEVSFNNKNAAYNRFRNTNYLPQAVMALSRDDSKAEVFEHLIEQTQDEDIRYLKIVYRLNPELPFRFQGTLQNTIRNLFDEAQKTPDNFWKADELFRNGHLQIWLEETDAVTALKLNGLTPTTPNFLHFFYGINVQYPFYLNQIRVNQPEDLAAVLRQDTSLWPLTTNYIRNHYIATWFESIGQKNLNGRYNRLYDAVLYANWYTDLDRNLAAVDALIRTIDPNSAAPKVGFDQKAIQLVNIRGSKNIQYGITVALQNVGYVAISLLSSGAPDGVTLSTNYFAFNSYGKQSFGDIKLNIDVFKLIKDKVYQFKIIAKTPYETVELPVQLKVVFPSNSVVKRVALYGLFAATMWVAPFLLFASWDRTVNFLMSVGVLLVFGKIMELAMKKELGGYNTPPINKTPLWAVLILLYAIGPSYYMNAANQPYTLFFFYWLFAGAAAGIYIACKKFNLNKWLPLIPLLADVLISAVIERHLF